MGYCYAITSGKGGTGKSTIAACLALAFSNSGKRTLLIDMDEGLRCLDIMLGIESEIVFDLSDILEDRDIDDAVYSVPNADNLWLIPAPRTTGKIDSEKFKEFCSSVIKDYEVLIFDFPAGMDFSLYSHLPKSTVVLAVCNPDPVSVRDAAAVCENLPFDSLHTRLIINKFHYKTIFKGIYENIDNIIDNSGFRLVGVVPESDELSFFSINHKIKKKGRAMSAFRRITDRLCGMHIALPKPKKI
ncbi:MAG: septum site-determining protein MinD [Ruminococcaceae bacterium]|nr:septum site-determining protein MinD [Oscillospiraceae bacterium]